jgi:hypothetical protein
VNGYCLASFDEAKAGAWVFTFLHRDLFQAIRWTLQHSARTTDGLHQGGGATRAGQTSLQCTLPSLSRSPCFAASRTSRVPVRANPISEGVGAWISSFAGKSPGGAPLFGMPPFRCCFGCDRVGCGKGLGGGRRWNSTGWTDIPYKTRGGCKKCCKTGWA